MSSRSALPRRGAALLALSLAATTTAQAQARFGALGGASLATITDVGVLDDGAFGDAITLKRRTGFQIGAYLQLPLGMSGTSALSFQPEVHYIQKGTRLEASLAEAFPGLDNVTGSIDLTYIEVPLLLRADLGAGRLRPFIVAGPSIALRTGCKLGFGGSGASFSTDCDAASDFESGDSPIPGNVPETSDDPIKKTDVGGIVGIGVGGTAGGRALSVQVRYARGFTTISRERVDGVSPRNTGISILFGVGF